MRDILSVNFLLSTSEVQELELHTDGGFDMTMVEVVLPSSIVSLPLGQDIFSDLKISLVSVFSHLQFI
jgi:hypothetical protein